MDTIQLKKNDTGPALTATLQYRNGTPIDLTGGSVWFEMGNYSDYSSLMSGLCTITGSQTGQVQYNWNGSTDTGSVGTWWGEFRFIQGGSKLTLPGNHSLQIQINEDYI